mmetsp:Transcript_49678/g.126256  ORF Transcript_49678/g.126256 Transcript_49678/m.126256 type:complete len:358 (+) Transcript_49678:414-1487(+)
MCPSPLGSFGAPPSEILRRRVLGQIDLFLVRRLCLKRGGDPQSTSSPRGRRLPASRAALRRNRLNIRAPRSLACLQAPTQGDTSPPSESGALGNVHLLAVIAALDDRPRNLRQHRQTLLVARCADGVVVEALQRLASLQEDSQAREAERGHRHFPGCIRGIRPDIVRHFEKASQPHLKIGRQVAGSHERRAVHVLELHPQAVQEDPGHDGIVLLEELRIVLDVTDEGVADEAHVHPYLVRPSGEDPHLDEREPPILAPEREHSLRRHVDVPQHLVLRHGGQAVRGADHAAELAPVEVLPLLQGHVDEAVVGAMLTAHAPAHQGDVLLLHLVRGVLRREMLEALPILAEDLHAARVAI